MSVRHFEDLEVGERHEFGGHTVTKAAIIEFAEKYDPQPFHTDEEAAKDSIFGGLVAPGWMTVCVYNRMLVDEFLTETANLGGRSASDIRWHRPLRPGTTVSGRVTVLKKRPSTHHDDRGYVDYRLEALGDDGEPLVSMTVELIVGRRT